MLQLIQLTVDSLPQPPPRAALPAREEWATPPPSYLTELEPSARPFGLLTQRDLSRLVNRVTMLRQLGPLQERIDEESHSDEDPVEVLARRIAREDLGEGSNTSSP